MCSCKSFNFNQKNKPDIVIQPIFLSQNMSGSIFMLCLTHSKLLYRFFIREMYKKNIDKMSHFLLVLTA